MAKNFTLLILSQHYPVFQHFKVFSCNDIEIDADIAGFLETAEQQANQRVVDNINARAAAAVQH